MSGARIRTNVGPLMANGVAVGTGDGLGSGDAARAGPAVAPAWFETLGEIGRSAPHAAVIIATTAATITIRTFITRQIRRSRWPASLRRTSSDHWSHRR